MNTFISRVYPNAFFAIDIKSQESIFIEGEISHIAEVLLNNPDYKVTQKDFPEYEDYNWESIARDCENIRSEIKAFIFGNRQGKTMEVMPSSKKNISQEDAMARLSEYSVVNWQLTNANIELTSHCNFRCKFCYLSEYLNQGMSIGELIKLGNYLRHAGVIFLSLTGGEIFMRPDILEILQAFSDMGFLLELKTNGSLLTPHIISVLSKLSIFDLQISIYETHDGFSENTRRHYDFRKISDNIRYSAESGLSITLSVMVGKHNIDSLSLIHRTLKGIADVDIFYSPYITPRRSGPDEETFLRLSYLELKNTFIPFLKSIDAFIPQEKYRDCERCSSPCYAGRDQIAIDVIGNVYPCLDLPEVMGNARESYVGDIISIESRKKAMSKFLMKDMTQCLSCEIREYCDSCVGIAIIENGDYRQPVGHKCDISRSYTGEIHKERRPE